tara:strand:- start:12395 stop:12952 length:558 start_codon:yes stop_codon:yes gene_type:complete
MENTISNIADFIKRYKSIANIRFTLGKNMDKFGFEKHLFQKENYSQILNTLISNPNWEDKNDFTLSKNNKIPFKIIDKVIYNIKNSPYDLIIEAESKKFREIYISEEYIRKEVSFFRKCHTFQVYYENTVAGGDIFNFNLILCTQKREEEPNTDTYNSHSSLLKIIDILKVVDTNIPNEYVFEKL